MALGNIFCNESAQYKSFSKDLVSDELWKNKDEAYQIAIDNKEILGVAYAHFYSPRC